MSCLIIVRDVKKDKSVSGRVLFNGSFVCYSLENAEKLIPCGTYTIENSISPKFERELPLIYNKDVPSSRGVRIHRGNSWRDSSACVLVGMRRDIKKNFITESTSAETMITMLCRNVDKLIICDE